MPNRDSIRLVGALTVPHRGVFYVSDVVDVQKLKIMSRPRRVEIKISLLTSDVASKLQNEINRELSQCGCYQASGALLVSLPILVTAISLWPIGRWWQGAIVVVVCSLAIMCLAKWIAVAQSSKRYRLLIERLEQHLRDAERRRAYGKLLEQGSA